MLAITIAIRHHQPIGALIPIDIDDARAEHARTAGQPLIHHIRDAVRDRARMRPLCRHHLRHQFRVAHHVEQAEFDRQLLAVHLLN